MTDLFLGHAGTEGNADLDEIRALAQQQYYPIVDGETLDHITNFAHPAGDPRRYGAVGNGVADDTVAIQNWVDACSSDNGSPTSTTLAAIQGVFPEGPTSFRCTAPIRLKKQFVRLQGAGMWQSQLYFDSVTTAYFVTDAIQYLRPTWSDFSIVGNVAATGKGIDLSNITGQVYGGAIQRIFIQSGGDGIYAPLFFSMIMDNVFALSLNGHAFRVWCGVGVLWNSCYAIQCGPEKAGYRLAGHINMQSCNGLNFGGWWGVFGHDPASADGFENDFPSSMGASYPSILIEQGNIEEFTIGGVRVQAPHIRCDINGKIDRNNLTTPYNALVHVRQQPFAPGVPVRLNCRFFQGTGVPNGGVGLTHAYFYGQNAFFEDVAGTAALVDPAFYDASSGIYRPLVSQQTGIDVFGDSCYTMPALKPRRLSVQLLRYDLLALTPAADPDQVIDVTGYTKVKLTPAGAASFRQATFDTTIGAGLDFDRNGDLIIEFGNNNATINHNYGAAFGFRLLAGVALAGVQGQVVRFVWSDNYLPGVAGWVQV